MRSANLSRTAGGALLTGALIVAGIPTACVPKAHANGEREHGATVSAAIEPHAADPLTRFLDRTVTGGLAVAATCVNFADPADGGPNGGILELAGIPSGAEVLEAHLYWTVLGETQPVAAGAPTLDGTALTAVRIGEVARTPCFDQQVATAAFRADASTVVEGDGSYRLDGLPGTGTDSGDITEGAALFVIWCSPDALPTRVVVWDGLDVTTGEPGPTEAFAQTLDGFLVDPRASVRATLALAAGNGQGAGDPMRESADPFFFNDVDLDPLHGLLDGALCPPADPGGPGHLFDRTVVDVSDLVSPGDTTADLEVRVDGDCHSFAAVALAVSTPPGPATGEPSALDRNPDATPLLVTKTTDGRLAVTWEELDLPSHLYGGTIGTWYDHSSIGRCSLPDSATVVDPVTGGRYYLAAGVGCAGEAGSFGRNSFGTDRAPAGVPCP